MNKSIGIFDSGVGGPTVLKAIKKLLPMERLVYLGDTARVPYGTKSRDNIIRYSIENTRFLLQHDIKMLVVACNTSAAASLKTLKEMFDVPIVGVIEPGARRAVAVTRTGRIGVIGTEATVKSGAYAEEIKTLKRDAVVFSKACPLFVPLVEEGLTSGVIADHVIKRYLAYFSGKRIDTIVLGCTHYPLLAGGIRRFFGGGVTVVDSAGETAAAVKELLAKQKNLRKAKPRDPEFYVTDAAHRFLKIGKAILKGDMERVSVVKVGG